MTWLALVGIPLLALLVVLFPRTDRRATTIMLGATIATSLAAIALAIVDDRAPAIARYVAGDAIARLFAPAINFVATGVAVYVRARVGSEPASRRFVVLVLAFLAAANLALLANHALLAWIALEITTLAGALLIVRPDAPASRLASWHYLMFSSVGLGLVLLGLVCVARGLASAHVEASLFLDTLEAAARAPTNAWRELGIALVLLGIGTKLGLAPMYSWLPETYDEAPASVTALLAAVQFNCAVVFLFRMVHVFRPSSPALVTGLLLVVGLASVGVSTASLVATRNVKRLLAYAAINHAGVMAIGLGLGANAAYGLLLYVLSNAFIKAILFLTAGKLEAYYQTKDTRAIAGLIKDLPYSGLFLMVGTFALLGFPPFGSFLGELLILSALVTGGQMFVFAAFCMLITISFVATGRTIFPMIWGEAKQTRTWPRQTALGALHKLIFLALLLVLGIYIPPQLNALLGDVAVLIGGAP